MIRHMPGGSTSTVSEMPALSRPILVVDDDRTMRHVISESLGSAGYRVEMAGSVSECAAVLRDSDPCLVLLDIMLPDGNGLDVLKQFDTAGRPIPIILITGSSDSESAIEASRYGALDYLTKPLDLRRLGELVGRVLAHQTPNQADHRGTSRIVPVHAEDPFMGTSDAMQAVFKNMGRVARQRVSVLLRGESGTGKELAARAIWRHSDRSQNIFLAVNCAALSSDLLESELFGHERGAFTGAEQRHQGKFEICDQGTLFLDEVGDMHPVMQSKLLRVLQERCFTRIGGNEEIPTDVRIISATHRDLEAMCRKGTFRGDLYHRLNGFSIYIPPLREREDDIRLLLSHFLHRYNQKLNKQVDAISAPAADCLTRYDWPGNVRELESVIGQVMLNSLGSEIAVSDLPPRIVSPQARVASENAAASDDNSAERPGGSALEAFLDARLSSDSQRLYEETLEYMERFLLGRVLQQTNGNQSAAARKLGITRGSLRFKLKNLGMSIDSRVRIPR